MSSISDKSSAKKKNNPLAALAAGCIAGGIEATAVWPMEYIKVKSNYSTILFYNTTVSVKYASYKFVFFSVMECFRFNQPNNNLLRTNNFIQKLKKKTRKQKIYNLTLYLNPSSLSRHNYNYNRKLREYSYHTRV